MKVPDDNFYRIIEPAKKNTDVKLPDKMEYALDNPIDNFSLASMSNPRDTAGIIVDPIIPAEIADLMLQKLTPRLERLGITKTNLFQRKRQSSNYQYDSKFTMIHPAEGSFVELGRTSRGTPVSLSEQFLDCGIKIALTMILPHYASGFMGGPDIIVPGVAAETTIVKNRSFLLKMDFLQSRNLESNLLYVDSMEACKLLGSVYNLCVVPDGLGDFQTVLAGELSSVFNRAIVEYLQIHERNIERHPDIVIVSVGKLFGQDLYHAIRVLSNVANVVKKGGTIILVAPCSNGIGDSGFLDYAQKFPERKQLAAELRYRFRMGAHLNMFLFNMLEKFRIELVSTLPDLYSHDVFHLKPCRTVTEAAQKAMRVEGKTSKILIVDKGDYAMPALESTSSMQTHL